MTKLTQSVIPAYLGLCLVLGGASAEGILQNLFLQLLAILIICWAILSPAAEKPSPAERQLLGLCALVLILVAAQLIPLPPDVWTKFPGREVIVDGYLLLGLPLPWQPISLAPYDTLSAGMWLLPAIAIVIGMVRLRAHNPRGIAAVIGGVAAISVIIGALQLFGDANNPFYFYEVTNRGSTTGFFSNSNHLATLLVVSIPFVAALYAQARQQQERVRSSVGQLTATVATLAVISVGVVMNWSFAGLGLAVPVLIATLPFFARATAAHSRWVLIGTLLVSIPLFITIFFSPLSESASAASVTQSSQQRTTFGKITAQAASDFFPVGTGGGSFDEIYATYEKHGDVDSVYVNHAHNDYLEVLLEHGAFGALLFILFAFWWMRSSRWISKDGRPQHIEFAATIASAAILAHSIVDYPTRTAALSAVFGACIALMARSAPEIRSR
jgi:O-antigen ligase